MNSPGCYINWQENEGHKRIEEEDKVKESENEDASEETNQ
jgi:hypothetical protein